MLNKVNFAVWRFASKDEHPRLALDHIYVSPAYTEAVDTTHMVRVTAAEGNPQNEVVSAVPWETARQAEKAASGAICVARLADGATDVTTVGKTGTFRAQVSPSPHTFPRTDLIIGPALRRITSGAPANGELRFALDADLLVDMVELARKYRPKGRYKGDPNARPALYFSVLPESTKNPEVRAGVLVLAEVGEKQTAAAMIMPVRIGESAMTILAQRAQETLASGGAAPCQTQIA